MYNFQLWAATPELVTAMVTDVLNKIKNVAPIKTISNALIPNAYILSGKREATNLNMVVTNTGNNTSGYFLVEDKSNEDATINSSRKVPFAISANGKSSVSIPMSDNYESTIVDFKSQEAAIVSLLEQYSKSVDELFKAEDSIKNKLGGYDDLAKRLDIVLSLDFNDAMGDVYKSILNYITQFLKDNNIYESFMVYTNARRKFIMYRKLLKIKETINVGSDGRALPECSICMTDPIGYAFVPCGHAYCKECTHKQQINCYTCRSKINQRMKLYI
jgi:hypothetical protein